MTRDTSDRWYDDSWCPAVKPRVGIDETVLCDATPEQGAAFVAGTLDYCDGCMDLVPPFTGDHCTGCEEYCREHFGTCGHPGCEETATRARLERPAKTSAEVHAEIARLRALGRVFCEAHGRRA